MLNNFSSIFEILVALNLSYAGSQQVRDAVNVNILRIRDALSEKHRRTLKKLNSEINLALSDKNGIRMTEECLKMLRYFEINSRLLTLKEQQARNFTKGTKSLFVIGTFYCFLILTIGGYEQFYSNLEIEHLLCFVNLNITLVFILFCRNLIPKYSHLKTKPLTNLFLFSIPLLLYGIYRIAISYGYVDSIYMPSTRTNLLISLFTASSAFIFHLSRAFIHRTYFRYQYYKLYTRASSNIKVLESNLQQIKNFKSFNKPKETVLSQLKNLLNAIRRDK